MMYWEETFYDFQQDKPAEIKYFACTICKNYPAMAIKYDDNQEGPFCELCWHVHVTKQFDALRERLDNEDEGDMPPCKGECVCGRDCHKEEQRRQAELDKEFAEYCQNEFDKNCGDESYVKNLYTNEQTELNRKFAEFFEVEENRKMFDETINKGLITSHGVSFIENNLVLRSNQFDEKERNI